MPVLTGPPVVTLRHASAQPYDAAIAAARTCYAPRVIGAGRGDAVAARVDRPAHLRGRPPHGLAARALRVRARERQPPVRVDVPALAPLLQLRAVQPALRAARRGRGRYVPEGLAREARAVYEGAIESAWESYRRLTELLKDDTQRILADAAAPDAERLREAAEEGGARGGEEGDRDRPLRDPGRGLHLDGAHGLGHRAAPPAPDDAHRRRAARDPRGGRGDGRPREASSTPPSSSASARGRWPRTRWSRPACPRLGGGRRRRGRAPRRAARRAHLAARRPHGRAPRRRPPRRCARSWAPRPDALGDDEALERLAQPRDQPLPAGDAAALGALAAGAGACTTPAYTFLKKLSHTADSQDQRHRMVPASRPLMTPHRHPPARLRHAAARRGEPARRSRSTRRRWSGPGRPRTGCSRWACPLEQALYLLPNAKALRFHESGSLLYLAHKWVMRTCFNAQEEIYRASMDELEQVRAVHPRLARHMGPPCVLRYRRITPTCTEGEHFCGVPVWRQLPRRGSGRCSRALQATRPRESISEGARDRRGCGRAARCAPRPRSWPAGRCRSSRRRGRGRGSGCPGRAAAPRSPGSRRRSPCGSRSTSVRSTVAPAIAGK